MERLVKLCASDRSCSSRRIARTTSAGSPVALIKGMEAMKTTNFSLAAMALLALGLATGCQTAGSRYAWMNPATYFHRSAETAVADGAPELPSAKLAADKSDVPPIASAPPASPPAASVASAPASDHSVFPAAPPSSFPSLASSTPDAPAASTGSMAPQAGPYSAVAPTAVASAPAATSTGLPGSQPTTTPSANSLMSSAPPTDAYAAPTSRYDRYATPSAPLADSVASAAPPASPAAPTATTPAANTNLASTPADTGSYQPRSRYDTPSVAVENILNLSTPSAPAATASTTPVATPPVAASVPATTAPIATTTPAVETNETSQAMATVEVPSTPGGYRPGGTSTYPTTQTSVNVATRPAGAETTTPPTPPSAYGTPTNRY